ncbi:nuclear transport factor 2 family protein [Streptomyces sp. NPDC048606]|uniref:nuclear transport factor 2 family protein n=1 Tax=Streptomyces sp. NPDC048606 TaxID=3154726 RepID=UPI00341E9EB9
MTSTPHKITVLGLGRMGAAMATRLAGHGFEVTGWTRSGGRVSDLDRATDPSGAVAGRDLVLLALFDGPACRQVLDEVRASLGPDTLVVNTGTISPDEAAGLARLVGPSYVHAPLLGSVPAAETGALRILAAGRPAALERARPVLDVLGTVRPVADAPTAAALKLIANHSLAGGVLALRDTLRQADALGLPREDVLDVLELGTLGALVARKRRFLDGGPQESPAEFTIRALGKDMALLGGASSAPLRGGAALSDASPAFAEADIAVAATLPAAPEAVLAPLRAYVRGHATGEPAHFRDAFLPTARIEGIRDGAFVSWGVEEYCALFSGRPALDEPMRSRRVESLDVHHSVATATMTLVHGPDTFTDVFLLTCVKGAWRIANKAYHRHDRP